jgi:hypothetical protein
MNDNWYKLFIQLAKDWSNTKTNISKSFCSMLLSENRGGPLFYWLPMWIESEIWLGNGIEMKKIILPLIELSEHTGLIGPLPFLLGVLTQIEMEVGDRARADETFRKALQLAKEQLSPMMEQIIVKQFSSFLISKKYLEEYEQLAKEFT